MTDTVSPGRIVTYVLTQRDADNINDDLAASSNVAHAGDKYPALVIRTFSNGNSINAQVFYDGDGQLWVTSRAQSIEPVQGFWHWPARV